MANNQDTIIANAKEMINVGWKYIYGYKGSIATESKTRSLIAQYPSAFDSTTIKLALAKTGQMCVDCSGFVCIAAGISHIGSSQIYSASPKKWSINDTSHILNAMHIWRQGHVGIIEVEPNGQKWVLEAKGTRYDLTRTKFDTAKKNFTHYGEIPGVTYNSNVSQPSTPSSNGTSTSNSYLVNRPSTTTGNLHMREGNGTQYKSILIMPKGAILTILDVLDNGWYKISYNGKTGYSSGKYIYTPWVGMVTANALNVRTAPNAGSAKLAAYPTLEKTNLVDVIGEENGWYRVRIADKYFGWVSGEYIERH